ncbi:MAG: AsmA-like C-terminal region-containing protein [Planktomarina sp.]|nr:AsmA-like C-terminal region-containing protein [Planktomarina sp.]
MAQSAKQDQDDKAPPRRRPMSRLVLAFYTSCWAALLCFGLLVAILQDRMLPVPEPLRVKLLQVLNANPSVPIVQFSRAELGLTELFHPRLVLHGVQFSDGQTGAGVQFGALNVVIHGPALLFGQIAPRSLTLSDAIVDLRRRPDGSFDFGFVISAGSTGVGSIDEILGSMEEFFEGDDFNRLTEARLDQLTVNYTDRVTNRAWTLDGGRLSVKRDNGLMTLRGDLALLAGGGELATLGLFYNATGPGAGTLGAEFDNLPAQDLAVQSKALTWLNFVDGKLSGSFRSLRVDGKVGKLNALLDFGAGTLSAEPESYPVSYSEAKTYFTYHPKDARLDISRASIKSDWGALSAEGYALLQQGGASQSRSSGMVLHLDLDRAVFDKTPWWPEPLRVTRATGQLKLNYDPLTLDLGLMQAEVNGADLSLSGHAALTPLGWSYDGQGRVPSVDTQTLMTLWPDMLKSKSRRWFGQNVRKGTMKNLTVDLRQTAGTAAVLASSFQFEEAEVKFMRHMPVISEGLGYGVFERDEFILALETGYVQAAEGGRLHMDGSTMRVPNARMPDPIARFDLKGRGAVPTVMSLLDNKPFQILTKTKRGIDDVLGQAQLAIEIETRLKTGITPREVAYDLTGTLRDLSSEVLVPGRMFTAQELQLTGAPDLLEISGEGRVSDIPFTGIWSQPLGAENLPSQVTAKFELSSRSLKALNIALPAGSLSGVAEGALRLDIAKNKPMAFELSSDLTGARLQSAALNWSKPEAQAAQLRVQGVFGQPVQVNILALEAQGLSLEGTVEFDDEGLDRVVLSRLAAGDWLDGAATFIHQGAGAPMRLLLSGDLDLRSYGKLAGGDRAPSDASRPMPMSLNLGRLQLSNNLFLSEVRADFDRGLAAGGAFAGRVNGGVRIKGQMSGQSTGLRLSVTSQDAGGVLRDAGLLRQASGGEMVLDLAPHADGWNGAMNITSVRVNDAPAIAQLLSAASIVGLPDQLDGKGIFFATIEGEFNLNKELFTIYRSSAVGPSLGMSMDGYIDTKRKQLDLQGVLSPFYLLNGLGSILTRRGEGLIGFNFTLRGPLENPQASVNPLSLFTPGMFREIFRRRPPQQD